MCVRALKKKRLALSTVARTMLKFAHRRNGGAVSVG